MSQRVEARIISLATSTDRRALVAENLKSFCMPWQFHEAVRGDGVCRFEPSVARQLRRFGRALTGSEIGCFKSHVLAMQEFERSEFLDWLLVIEDDVWVDPEFDFLALIEFLDRRKLNYLRLYARRWKPASLIAYFGERQFIRFKTDPYGAQAYLLNRRGAKQFLHSFDTIDRPIDDELGRFWKNKLDIYSIFPFPVIERSVASTLLEERNKISKSSPTLGRYLYRIAEFSQKHMANLSFGIRTVRRDAEPQTE
jgi:glycosyl transferase, family 25